VLAMPISVIATSFSQVWTEWNLENAQDKELRDYDLKSVSKALTSLQSKTKLLIEFFDDRVGREQHEFLGQAEYENLPLGSPASSIEEMTLNLVPNKAKGCEETAGVAHVLVRWRPTICHDLDEGGLPKERIQGTLDVRLLRAEGLLRSDWKKQGMRDTYAVVHCWPSPPSTLQDEHLSSSSRRTLTVKGSNDPEWEESFSFDFDWPCDWDLMKANPQEETVTRKISAASDQPITQSVSGLGAATVESLLDLRKVVEEQCRTVKQLSSSISQTEALLQEALNKSTGRAAAYGRSRSMGSLR